MMPGAAQRPPLLLPQPHKENQTQRNHQLQVVP